MFSLIPPPPPSTTAVSKPHPMCTPSPPPPPPPPPPPTDASRFPLIRDILKTFSPTRTTTTTAAAAAADTHPSSWLSSPGVMAAFRKNMPLGYRYASRAKTHVDAAGRLVVWGVPEAEWRFCLRVDGLEWTTLGTDLLDLLDGHDVVDSPVIVGGETGFTALVYMRSAKGCEGVIADLDGAEVARETVVRVGLATETDLERVLLIQDINAGKRG